MFYNFAKAVTKPFAFFLFWLKVIGRENEPMSGPLIVCGNHISYIDPALIGIVLKRTVRYMSKAEAFKVPVMGLLLKLLKVYPVNRGSADLNATKITLKILKEGGVIGMFPEGTRVRDDESVDIKAGIAMFANKTKATILPVGLKCNGKVRIFRRIKIIIGKPIKYEELQFTSGNAEDLKRVSEDIMKKVRELLV